MMEHSEIDEILDSVSLEVFLDKDFVNELKSIFDDCVRVEIDV